MNDCQIFDMEHFRQNRLLKKAINDFDKARGPAAQDTMAMHRKLTELINGLGQIISTYENKAKRPIVPSVKI